MVESETLVVVRVVVVVFRWGTKKNSTRSVPFGGNSKVPQKLASGGR
jgi:hypothetical protein